MNINSLNQHISANEIPLDRLASNNQLSDAEKIEGVSKHFEAIFLRQFLMEGQKPLLNTKDSMGNATNQIYRDMMVNNLADEISKSGKFGLSKFFQQQLTPKTGPVSNDVDAPKLQ
jgi:Rod binding domain-containing protein